MRRPRRVTGAGSFRAQLELQDLELSVALQDIFDRSSSSALAGLFATESDRESLRRMRRAHSVQHSGGSDTSRPAPESAPEPAPEPVPEPALEPAPEPATVAGGPRTTADSKQSRRRKREQHQPREAHGENLAEGSSPAERGEDLARAALDWEAAIALAGDQRPQERRERPTQGTQMQPVDAQLDVSGRQVRLDGVWYRIGEAGSSVGEDVNMCFYMSAALSSGVADRARRETRAAQLKKILAGRANGLASGAEKRVDFGAPGIAAEEEVIWAYAALCGPIIVYDLATRQAHAYYHMSGLGSEPVRIYSDGGYHFQALLRA